MSNSPFERFTDDDLRDLIAEYPLALVGAEAGPAQDFTPLPLLGEYDANGRLTHLFGHMSRSNSLFHRLSNAPRASFLFQGPHAYVSPEHAGRRDWAPTWNYVSLRVSAQLGFLPQETRASVSQLTHHMEKDRHTPWHVEEVGERLEPMLERIIAFRAEVTAVGGRFKLGQDETPETLRTIFATTQDAGMRRWMARFNQGRL